MGSPAEGAENQPSYLELAESIAREAHQGQFRRDGSTPYIEHPAAVVRRVGNDAQCQAAAWLHDVIEDSELTADALVRRGIPKAVVDAVDLLTKRAADKSDYLGYLHRLAGNRIATQVKIADMLSNLSDTPSKRQIVKYAQGLLVLNGRGDLLK